MKTITIQIGNSDDRLAQTKWSQFVKAVGYWVHALSKEVHFFGTSNGDSVYQNCCWVCVMDDGPMQILREHLLEIKSVYLQDSISWIEGTAEFI